MDDPYRFGQIAAANSLSDVYAMNGRPLTALNIVGFPDDELDLGILAEILRGADERVRAAGAVTVGGHSVRDAEVKFGLSVTGLVDPAELMTNAGGRVGDALVLTKPLGTGFVATAAKKEECPETVLESAVASMIALNSVGRDAFREVGGVHAVTDVTGFGLLGHGSEMADGSGVTIEFDSRALPALPGVESLAVPKYYTRAAKSNRAFLEGRLELAPTADALGIELAFDPQTSGGLLIAVEPARAGALVASLQRHGSPAAAVVGRVVERRGPIAVVLT